MKFAQPPPPVALLLVFSATSLAKFLCTKATQYQPAFQQLELRSEQQVIGSHAVSATAAIEPVWGVGWAEDNKDDPTKAKIKKGLNDALLLADAAIEALSKGKDAPKLVEYFGELADAAKIKDVYVQLKGYADLKETDPAKMRKNLDCIYFSKPDIGPVKPGEKSMCKRGSIAYYTNMCRHSPEGDIIYCKPGLATKELPKVTKDICDSFKGSVSQKKMESFARVTLHEILHHPQVGFNSKVRARIDDMEYVDDDGDTVGVYGLCNIRKFAAIKRGSYDHKAEHNSDSYAWYAQEMYYSKHCRTEFKSTKPEKSCSIF